MNLHPGARKVNLRTVNDRSRQLLFFSDTSSPFFSTEETIDQIQTSRRNSCKQQFECEPAHSFLRGTSRSCPEARVTEQRLRYSVVWMFTSIQAVGYKSNLRMFLAFAVNAVELMKTERLMLSLYYTHSHPYFHVPPGLFHISMPSVLFRRYGPGIPSVCFHSANPVFIVRVLFLPLIIFSGNTIGEDMYKLGEPCSRCPRGTKCMKSEFYGLCGESSGFAR